MAKQFPAKQPAQKAEVKAEAPPLQNEGVAIDRLAAFSKRDQKDMKEGTSTYYKWKELNESFDGLFIGTETRSLDSKNPDKMTECAIFLSLDNTKYIMAQTVIVKEVKKKWDEVKEVGFPVRIIYTGKKGEGSEEYQTFRLLFE